MLGRDELGDLVGDMVDARASGDNVRVVAIMHGLVTGPRGDALNVALLLAGILAMDLGDDPEGGFYRVEVEHPDGHGNLRPGSATDLPGHVATFVQMVVAIANEDRDMARDLFLGHVGSDGQRALALLTLALNEVVHQNQLCPQCGSEGRAEAWVG